jgi:hypothetical protein
MAKPDSRIPRLYRCVGMQICIVCSLIAMTLPAQAGPVAVVGDVFALLPANLAVTQVQAVSTDGCNFSPPPDVDLNVAFSSDFCSVRSTSAAAAFAQNVVGVLNTAVFAFTAPGPGEQSDAGGAARANGRLAAEVAGPGGFAISIDPDLINEGDSLASMTYRLFFRNEVVFTAGAIFEDGVLTTSGSFGASDFDVFQDGPRTTARLVTTDFFIPFTIANSEIGQMLPYAFEQAAQVSASNGGFAAITAVPEPASIGLLWIAIVMLLLIRHARQSSRACTSRRSIICWRVT